MAHSISALFQEFDQWSPVQGTTKRKCRYSINKLIGFVGDIDAENLTSAIAGRFQAYMKKSGMSDSSVGSYFAAASQVFAWSVRQGLLGANPFDEAKKVRLRKMEVRTYQARQIEALLKAVDLLKWSGPVSPLRWTGFFLLGLHGLRAGEIWNLRWDDIELDEGIIQVRYRPDKKAQYWQWGSKGKAEREIPMSDDLWSLLCRLQIIAAWRYPFLKKCTCLRLQSQIGNLSEFTRKAPYNNFHREFKRIKRAAKIESGDFHQLRKTAGTQLAQQGVPLHEAKTLLGHSSMRTTLSCYVAVDRQLCMQHGRAAFNAYQWAR